jgi:hypothetical protein
MVRDYVKVRRVFTHQTGGGARRRVLAAAMSSTQLCIAAPYQTSRLSAALPNSSIIKESSPTSAIFLAASAQPVRAGRAGLRITDALFSMVVSAPALRLKSACVAFMLGGVEAGKQFVQGDGKIAGAEGAGERVLAGALRRMRYSAKTSCSVFRVDVSVLAGSAPSFFAKRALSTARI